MVKHFCDMCKKEKRTSLVYLPTLKQDGFNNNFESNFKVIRKEFDVCYSCLTDIAKYIYEKSGKMKFEDSDE